LVPIVEVDGEAAIVVTRRVASMTFHRGDWVFPGGGVEQDVDEVPEAAARREASEELGVPQSSIEIVGAFDVHGPIVTGFVIHPFVGVILPGVPLVPDPREVGEVAVVPLAQLLADGSYRMSSEYPHHEPGPAAAVSQRREPSDGRASEMPFFLVSEGAELWGTQGAILYDVLAHLVEGC
jgi:ADP-ribose pyrophosphatase YjhB (NUDIX family)